MHHHYNYFDRCNFNYNTASNNGGALCLENFSTMIIDGCNFIFNSAPNGIGGAIYAPSVNTEITITGSKAELNNAF